MPSGKRFRVSVSKVLYDMSPEQFELLAKRAFTLRRGAAWKDLQRAQGLVNKKLFTVEVVNLNAKYTRTPLGVTVYRAVNNKLKAEV